MPYVNVKITKDGATRVLPAILLGALISMGCISGPTINITNRTDAWVSTSPYEQHIAPRTSGRVGANDDVMVILQDQEPRDPRDRRP